MTGRTKEDTGKKLESEQCQTPGNRGTESCGSHGDGRVA